MALRQPRLRRHLSGRSGEGRRRTPWEGLKEGLDMGFIASRLPTGIVDAKVNIPVLWGAWERPLLPIVGSDLQWMEVRFLAKLTLSLCLFIMVCLVAEIMRKKWKMTWRLHFWVFKTSSTSIKWMKNMILLRCSTHNCAEFGFDFSVSLVP